MADLDLIPTSTPVPIRGLRSIQRRVKHFPDPIRESFVIQLQNVRLTGRSIHYPNCLLQTTDGLINPYDERVMSLQKDTFYDGDKWAPPSKQPPSKQVCSDPVYFFIYNVDNYYHFIYDSLPILAGYFSMRETNSSLQLLIQTSHPTKQSLPPFVTEMLGALGITTIQFANVNTQYEQMFVGTSLTHGQSSNSRPSPQAYSVWSRPAFVPQTHPKRIYVSRRSWVHGQTANLGTNYTTRRKCVNETALVNLLQEYGIKEVFTECISTETKLAMFAQAEVVVGVIGGGMCNLLFSPQTTKSLCIVTPEFLRINERFKYSMDHTQIKYSYSTNHVESPNTYTLYTRVKVINPESPAYGQVGEIEELLQHNAYVVRMSSNDVAGFSQDFAMEARVLQEWELEALDGGLNSPYVCDLAQVEADLIAMGLTREQSKEPAKD